MKTYILLFRGINVGGRNLLPMQELTALLKSSGYQQVKTYIQSGNVVLNSDRHPSAAVSELIDQQFGFKPQLMVLDTSEFKTTVENNPFSANEGKSIHFYFLAAQPSPDIKRLDSLAISSESYAIKGQVLYLYAPDGVGRSKLAAQVEKCMGVAATARNLNTINKLSDMVGS